MTLARLAAIGQPVTGAITLTMLAVDSSGQAKPFNAALTKVVIDQI
jgi:hypothetical protein